ncbi:DUF1738 domain-containing protein [Mesorhizobium sp. M2A.F.Ca.ET.037.01.1.1]|uniref:ArdC family protein n=1 Tax=unclassified Mesorhizobium TaxID=325217 RepID=UPI000F74FF95|nr:MULTISPECIES: zincin-like metallopeptidase domain-containing protein [unclassified Mesorhizobium]AZO16041.1 DUF1738 domain-containing protein [Mesorhizobium sp. M2A.F.Ca.ET.043.05.1.1]RUX23406.1 DUF1738 domain-containing protein [Mesorhizobium sp. M2A.F.Ca.ET.037.01.1.1]RWA89207.1 MAG: DUF1738 domain-containing protein [Mesorhizobium sp.]TIV20121.1 MAG: DUF1738 domain-containing protein [Mesorhizobium sp.]
MVSGIYRQVTDALIEQLQQTHSGAWVCPWHRTGGGLPVNGKTGQRYRGINILNLWCAAERSGFADNRWASYRQWQSKGAQVRRGEKGTLVVFYKEIDKQQNGAEGADEGESSERRYVLRTSVLFNRDQVDGLPPDGEPQLESDWTADKFDRFLDKTGAVVRFGGTQAFYSLQTDHIQLPMREHFKSPEGYAATAAHELVHWTGARARLSRDLSARFGKRAYAAEELVAELGSAFLLAGLGLASVPHENHAAYLAGWLPLLRDDPRAIFVAAAQASRAAEWLFESTGQAEDEPRLGDQEHDSTGLVAEGP